MFITDALAVALKRAKPCVRPMVRIRHATMLRRRLATVIAFVNGLTAASSLSAQPPEKLGTITFPNSGNVRAQAPFLKGMKLYWSFEYERAAESFREAQRVDPSFALAYVGEALTHTHQVWNQQDLPAARAALQKLAPTRDARLAKTRTARERRYAELAEALYGEGSKARRDTLFEHVAQRLMAEYPKDDEARTFESLALLGLNQGQREPVAYMQAGALAEEVLRRNRDHPGAAHFVIHAFDDPVHAPLGLWAAKLYSQIAPAAAHALHMTSHIFDAMGMWDDLIDVNRRAVATFNAGRAARGLPPRGCGHYGEWLHYGYLQAGRIRDAAAALAVCAGNAPPDSLVDGVEGLAGVRAAHLVDAPLSTLPAMPPGATRGTSDATAYWHFGTGVIAVARKDNAAVHAAVRALTSPRGAGEADPDSELRRRAFATELRAMIGEATVDDLDAVARAIEARPVEFGPPSVSKPVRELRAELLLKAGRAREAQAEYQRALAAFPGRSRSLLGLARAAITTGDFTVAQGAVRQLQANWHAADADLSELAELRELAAKLSRKN